VNIEIAVTYEAGGKLRIDGKCGSCQAPFQFLVSADGYLRWRNGGLIQRELPELNADERELLISGTCGECFDSMFRDNDEPAASKWGAQ
jgi:hypothetical protein